MPTGRRSRSRSSGSKGSDTLSGPVKKRLKVESEHENHRESKLIKVFIVSAKLSPQQVSSFVDQVEQNKSTLNISLCSNVKDADVIVTAVRMKRRFLRHVNWETAVRLVVVP